MSNPNKPLRNNDTFGQRYFFGKGARTLTPAELGGMTDREVRDQGRANVRDSIKSAVGIAALGGMVAGAPIGALMLEHGKPSTAIHNGPEARLSDAQIAEANGGIPATQAPKPTDINLAKH